MDIINSKDNRVLKQARKLSVKKHREQNSQFIIEGIRFVEEAFISKASIKYCLCSETLKGDRIEILLKNMSDEKIDTYIIKEGLVEEICETQNPQGIVAVVEKKKYDLDILIKKSGFIVVVDRVQDPGNLGTIIRTADAAGADGVIISQGTVDPYSSKALRSTMGSIFHIPVINASDMNETIDKLKDEGFLLYASSLEGKTKYYEEDYSSKTAIVIGNEANGVDNNILRKADKLTVIPMPGKAESLNAAVAAGILLFEIAKHKTMDKY